MLILVSIFILITIYIIYCLFLTKLNKIMYGKNTPMAWIPIVNIYLLGKLTIHKVVGWLLLAFIFLTGTYTITFNNVVRVYTLFPEEIKEKLFAVFDIITFALFIYAIYKYFKLKKENSMDNSQES